jgi:hypothetical protein
MVKFSAKTGEGKTLIGLGLTPENAARIMRDEPIVVDLEEFGIRGGVVLIFGGESEDAIRDLLTAGKLKLIGPETRIEDRRAEGNGGA